MRIKNPTSEMLRFFEKIGQCFRQISHVIAMAEICKSLTIQKAPDIGAGKVVN
jgi:hypothetical protein